MLPDKKVIFLAAALELALGAFLSRVMAQDSSIAQYRQAADRIIAESLADGQTAWNRLAELTDRFPGRLSGSQNLNYAIAWVTEKLKQDGFDNVHTEKVMVPHWVRNSESAEIVGDVVQPLAIAGLGGSVGTGPDGIQAEAIVVRNFDELDAQGSRVKGKIVVYNVIFHQNDDPLGEYRQGTRYRGSGASHAAKYGAVAALVRSIGPTAHRTPHTGGMRYSNDAPQIPVASISGEDADKLQRMQDRGQPITIRLKMGAETLPDAESANVIAEIRGREHPEQVVVIGGHLDSWDIAPGAMDDGGGDIATWEALRMIKKLNLVPRRTIRLVLFTNEENGTRGGQGYRQQHAAEMQNHVLALESDMGVLPVRGFGFQGSKEATDVIRQIASLLGSIGATGVNDKFDGADVNPMGRDNVPLIALDVDDYRYFYIHHTTADTVDKIDPGELAHCIAATAVMAYVAADLPQPLPRSSQPLGRGARQN